MFPSDVRVFRRFLILLIHIITGIFFPQPSRSLSRTFLLPTIVVRQLILSTQSLKRTTVIIHVIY